jgi:hypothetical protein
MIDCRSGARHARGGREAAGGDCEQPGAVQRAAQRQGHQRQLWQQDERGEAGGLVSRARPARQRRQPARQAGASSQIPSPSGFRGRTPPQDSAGQPPAPRSSSSLQCVWRRRGRRPFPLPLVRRPLSVLFPHVSHLAPPPRWLLCSAHRMPLLTASPN